MKIYKMSWLGWDVLKIYITLTIFQSDLDLETGDTQSLKFGGETWIQTLDPCSASQKLDQHLSQDILVEHFNHTHQVQMATGLHSGWNVYKIL